MHLHIVCALVCISLHFASADSKWEVINDVKPFDDSGTQEDILFQEELIPYQASRPRPKPKAAPRAPANTKNGARDPKSVFNVHNVPPPAPERPRPAAGLSQEKSEVEEEELLPLGVPRRRKNQRHLLQAFPVQGPKLPPDVELKRLLFRSGSVNLSTGCKDSEEEDCLFDVDDFVAKQLLAASGRQDSDFEFVDQDHGHAGKGSAEEEEIPLSRHKRQNNNGDDSDSSEEGSGISSEETLYENKAEHNVEGQYQTNSSFIFEPPEGTASLTDEDLENYQREIENQLTETMNSSLPGFVVVIVDTPNVVNGKLVSNFTVLIIGDLVADTYGEQTARENFNKALTDLIPELEAVTIFNNSVDPSYANVFVNELLDVVYNYCESLDPCPAAGPEFSVSDCVNTGFMSGYCPHNCEILTHLCTNNALCMLDENYQPYCNCGDMFTGEFCETEVTSENELSNGETVGVIVAGVACGLAVLSCCFFIVCCWRRDREVNYTYYEDEGVEEQLSDPTSIANYYINRPIVCTTPIDVLNTEGFDA